MKKVYPGVIFLAAATAFLSLGLSFDSVPKIDRDAAWMAVATMAKIPLDVAEREQPEAKVWIHHPTPTQAMCYVTRPNKSELIPAGFVYFSEGDEEGWFIADVHNNVMIPVK